MIVSANEYGNYVSMYIYGIDYTDEAQTISIEDLFTENTFSFVARDVSVFKKGYQKSSSNTIDHGSIISPKDGSIGQRYYMLPSSGLSLDDEIRLQKEQDLAKIKNFNSYQKNREYDRLIRNLYYSTSKTLIGNDVSKLQALLNSIPNRPYNLLNISGIFDEDTDKAVRFYQSMKNIEPDGIVTQSLYNMLQDDNRDENDYVSGIVINKNGTYGYTVPSIDGGINDSLAYNDVVAISEVIIGENTQKFYKTDHGYIKAEDIYSVYEAGNVIEFPTINFDDYGPYITLLQNILTELFGEYEYTSGLYDAETEKRIRAFQKAKGFDETGVVDNETWIALQNEAGNTIKSETSGVRVKCKKHPGQYKLKNNEIESLKDFDITMSSIHPTNVKISVVLTFPDKENDIISRQITVKDVTTFGILDVFPDAFNYKIEHDSIPSRIQYFVYPYSQSVFKWTFDYAK